MSTTLPEIDAQYRVLLEQCGLLARPDRRLLELRGGEGAELLQGQLTNDIEALEPRSGCYAALLDRKGKVRADMRVLRLAADRIWIEAGAAAAELTRSHLDLYKVGREVELERLEDLAVISLIGPQTAQLLGSVALGAEHDHGELRLAETGLRRLTTDVGADLILAHDDVERVREALISAGAEIVDERAAEILRVEAGRPALGAEIDAATMPQEAGINERAVSFTKGCYIGQETVARLHYKGKPNRHLRRLRADEPMSAGEEVRAGERVVGTIGTAVVSPARGPVALAILRREAEPGSEVLVAGRPATVEEIGG